MEIGKQAETGTGEQAGVLLLDPEEALMLTLKHIEPVLRGKQRCARISRITSFYPDQGSIAAYPTPVPVITVEVLEDLVFHRFGIDPDLAEPTITDLGDDWDAPGECVRETYRTNLTGIELCREIRYRSGAPLGDKRGPGGPARGLGDIIDLGLSIWNNKVPDYVPRPGWFYRAFRWVPWLSH